MLVVFHLDKQDSSNHCIYFVYAASQVFLEDQPARQTATLFSTLLVLGTLLFLELESKN